MLAPKKGLLCNLNHIHLQHISLGLHLSRHPELQETSDSMAGEDQTGCSDCQENYEQVDANSNNPSLKCHCCESHTQQPLMLGLENQAAPEDFPSLLDAGEEEVASPCDLVSSTSSSVSSCSDFSLDDSPVSVYCKGFSAEEPKSLGNQLDIIPNEDAQKDQSLADHQGRVCDGKDANFNPPVLQRPSTLSRGSPDSLCSSSSLISQCDETSPSAVAQEASTVCADLDPNCNPLSVPEPGPLTTPAPKQRDPGLTSAPDSQSRYASGPPPVPPRPRRRLQVLNGHRAELPSLSAGLAESEPGLGDLCRDSGKKTITSFHELAQKRKRIPTGPCPAQARVDRSDWLIVFSPDTELPPSSELLGTSRGPEPPQSHSEWAVRPPGSGQREVTTFKELRYRSACSKSKGQLAGEWGQREAPRCSPAPPEPTAGSGSSGAGQGPSGGAAGNLQMKRRRSRLGLQSIAEGQPLPRSPPGAAGLSSDPPPPWGGPGRDSPAPGTGEKQQQSREGARPSPAPGSAEGVRGERLKALLVAVSIAVDKVITHFSSARNLVQKAQLGDSWLNPDVGYLLLHTLCPALCALVEDGLKPFQKDVITGQRKNSPWSVVEASVKTGPNNRSFHALCWQVAALAPLKSSRQKFHAFILGLLNIKQLELWISHLQKSPGVISVLYSPTAFFALSRGPLHHLADELLLLIQPLSVLTFHVDLLFEHHHLSVDVRPLSRRLESALAPAHRSAAAWGALQPSLKGQSTSAGAGLEDELPPNTPGRAASTEANAGSLTPGAARGLISGTQVGAALQQTLQHVLRWGDQLGRSLLGADGSAETCKPEAASPDAGTGLSSWWGQLSQASRIYAAPRKEKFSFSWSTKLRTTGGDPSPSQASQPQCRGTELQLLQTKTGPELSASRLRSSADTLGFSSPEDLTLPAGAGAPTVPEDPAAGEKLVAVSPEPRNQAAPPDAEVGVPAGLHQSGWLGRLFGATSSSPSLDSISARSRRPSSWLSPSTRVLALVVKGLVAEKSSAQEQPERPSADPVPTPRAVRALCDHTGTADGHLSFQKGDILQLLSTVDEDWICCCHGNSTGLVPVGYTSLIL